MTLSKVCRVCNKFLKDTKRSSALYCGKSCKNKAVTLRRNESVLNRPEIAKTITPEHPLFDAPNIWDLMIKTNEIQQQHALHERHSKHIREIDRLKDLIRQKELAISNQKQERIDKLLEKGLFAFTNFIEKKVKPQSGLSDRNIKPQSGFMPLTSDDFADF